MNWLIPSPDLGVCSMDKTWLSGVIPQCDPFLLSLGSSSASPPARVQAWGRLTQPCPSAQPQSPHVWLTRQFPKNGAIWVHSQPRPSSVCTGEVRAPHATRGVVLGRRRGCGCMVCSVPSAEQGYALQCSICSPISRVIFSSEHVSVVWCWYEPLQLCTPAFL